MPVAVAGRCAFLMMTERIAVMNLRRLLLPSIVALAVSGLAAIAAGNFPNLPIVGGASYCGGTSTGTTGQVCTTTVPAGPSITTGSELVPADTQLSSGAAPQSVLLSMASLNALPYQFVNQPTGIWGFLISRNNGIDYNVGTLIIKSTGPITNGAVQMPPSPIDGQRLSIRSTVAITTFNVSPNSGQAISNGPISIMSTQTGALISPNNGPSGGVEFLYRAADATWYRLD